MNFVDESIVFHVKKLDISSTLLLCVDVPGSPGGQLQQMLGSPTLPQSLWSMVSDYADCDFTLLQDQGLFMAKAGLLFREMLLSWSLSLDTFDSYLS